MRENLRIITAVALALVFAGSRTLFVTSLASNLVPGDGNGTDDLFLVRWRKIESSCLTSLHRA